MRSRGGRSSTSSVSPPLPELSETSIDELFALGAPPIAELTSFEANLAREAAVLGDTSGLEALQAKCRSIIGFTEYRFPRYRTARHHRLVAEQLERVERGEIDRLMLCMPPRHGKSELASKSFPAHCIGLDPTEMFISASAGMELARDWGKDVRNIVMSQEFQTVFPDVTLAEDSKAAGKWNTRQGGSYYAVGVGSNILGRGANKVMIDDPFGSMEDAESEVIREKVWKWYCGTIYNRLQPGGAIVLIGHRLHPDDLHGRLIEQMKAGGDYADRWEIVNLPAIAQEPSDLNDWLIDPLGRKPGEALWKELFPLPALERIRRNSAFPRYWYALYQQNPIPDEGDMFTVAEHRQARLHERRHVLVQRVGYREHQEGRLALHVLELSQGAHDVHNQASARTRGVDRVGQAAEVDFTCAELGDEHPASVLTLTLVSLWRPF